MKNNSGTSQQGQATTTWPITCRKWCWWLRQHFLWVSHSGSCSGSEGGRGVRVRGVGCQPHKRQVGGASSLLLTRGVSERRDDCSESGSGAASAQDYRRQGLGGSFLQEAQMGCGNSLSHCLSLPFSPFVFPFSFSPFCSCFAVTQKAVSPRYLRVGCHNLPYRLKNTCFDAV